MKRTQIYLDDEQDRALADRADGEGRTKSALIREAIDRYLRPDDGEDAGMARVRAALDAIADDPITRLPPGTEYVERLRAADRERDRKLGL